jgi:adenylate cyclase
MGVEIERKFLVRDGSWKGGVEGRGVRVHQGYIVNEPGRSVRVRRKGERGFLTIKGAATGPSRPEFEYEIPLADAEALLAGFCGETIDKTRYEVEHRGHVWEVDEFHGDNAGLVVAELELASADEAFAPPAWLGDEVTEDARYLNAQLVKNPYRRWRR